MTSSLGLYTGYEQDQMDGKTTVMSQGWNLAAGNGIVGFQGVGNFGHDDDPVITICSTVGQIHYMFTDMGFLMCSRRQV